MTDHTDHTDRQDDDRIDALARAAGADLRRPAPADGLARAERAKRNRQLTRAGAGGLAAVMLVAVGAIALRGGDTDRRVVPATVSTPEVSLPVSSTPTNTVPVTSPSTSPSTTPPTTAPPVTTPPTDRPPVEVPDAVHTAAQFLAFEGTEDLRDPLTGDITESRPVDVTAAQNAQDALRTRTQLVGTPVNGTLVDAVTREYTLGAITYTFSVIGSEIQQPEPGTAQAYDRCGQIAVDVSGPAATALPARVARIAISADTRWLAVLTTACPDDGTLADGAATTPYTWSVVVFDAADPSTPGRTVLEGVPSITETPLTFSPDGRYLAVEWYDVAAAAEFRPGSAGWRYVELATGDEVDGGAGDCAALGTQWARFVGPWIGGSSIAVQLSCPSQGASLLVRDLATSEEIRVEPPATGEQGSMVADVDAATYISPSTAWWTVCEGLSSACSIGQGAGDRQRVELTGVAQASFLPLGFSYGG